jgi:hypothetical protein
VSKLCICRNNTQYNISLSIDITHPSLFNIQCMSVVSTMSSMRILTGLDLQSTHTATLFQIPSAYYDDSRMPTETTMGYRQNITIGLR